MTDKELMQEALYALTYVGDAKEIYSDTIESLRARLAQPEQEIESDQDHVEDDGCPTEKAVLQRFWREHQMQEPVAWKDAPLKIYLQVCDESDCDHPFDSHIEVSWCQDKMNDSDIPYFRADTAPPQREWQGLTDEEILEEYRQSYGDDGNLTDIYFAHAIQAKLKEKNT